MASLLDEQPQGSLDAPTGIGAQRRSELCRRLQSAYVVETTRTRTRARRRAAAVTVDPFKPIPLEVAQEHAKGDPTLQSMIDKGMPLTRDTYLAMTWGADMPKPADWNTEHEMEVPPPFRDPDAVMHRR